MPWVAVELVVEAGMDVRVEVGSVEVLAEWGRLPAAAGDWARPSVTGSHLFQWQPVVAPPGEWSEV
jgi:hypothetical protein